MLHGAGRAAGAASGVDLVPALGAVEVDDPDVARAPPPAAQQRPAPVGGHVEDLQRVPGAEALTLLRVDVDQPRGRRLVSDSVIATTEPVWVQRSSETAPRSPSPTPRIGRRPVPSGRTTSTVERSPPSAAASTASQAPSGDQRTVETRSGPVSIDHSSPVARRCRRTTGRPSPSQTKAMVVPSGDGLGDQQRVALIQSSTGPASSPHS